MKSLRLLFKPKPLPVKTTSAIAASSPPSSLETQFISLIHASKSTLHLRCIHAHLLYRNLFFNSSRIASQMISSSSLLSSPDYALSIFCHFHDKNLYIFNALIRGLTENSCFGSSIQHFVMMLRLGVKPDRLTYPYVLKSNAKLGFLRLGKSLHCGIVKAGVNLDSFVRVSLLDMYVKMEKLGFASKVFDESPEKIKNESILLWNVLINGCCRVGDLRKAMELFESMPERNSASWSSLINGLMSNGDLDGAKEVFDRMPEKNVVSWTAMVNGFIQNSNHERAVSMFFKMLEEDGVRPNEYSVVSVLSACAKIGALESGARIHEYLLNNGFELDGGVGTALVDMYAKCGNIESASSVFGDMKERDLLTWTAMIRGWAIHGRFEQATQCFKQMMYSGQKPDGVVFLVLLTACLNSGEVTLGLNFFESMRLDYSIEPMMKHYALVVELLGRVGRLNEALRFIERMPVNPDFMIWGALYRACRAHGSTKIAKLVYQRLLELEPKHIGHFVFLSNIYALEGKWQDVEKVKRLMQNRGDDKRPSSSYIEVDSQIHRFLSNDCSHQQTKEIILKLEEILLGAMEKGFAPRTGWCVHNLEEEEKEDVTGIHSEKLALAFGFLKTLPGKTIRITKKLRVCGDCHTFMKYVSKISQREIILTDVRRFHRFKDGFCSCGDYW